MNRRVGMATIITHIFIGIPSLRSRGFPWGRHIQSLIHVSIAVVRPRGGCLCVFRPRTKKNKTYPATSTVGKITLPCYIVQCERSDTKFRRFINKDVLLRLRFERKLHQDLLDEGPKLGLSKSSEYSVQPFGSRRTLPGRVGP